MGAAEKVLFRQGMCDYCQRFEMLDMINDAILLLDADSDEVLFMNQKALAMYGYDEDEVSGLTVLTLGHDALETRRGNRELIMKRGSKGHIFTENHIKKNGDIFKVEISARYLLMHGRPIIVALTRDLTVDGKIRREFEMAGKIQRRLLPRNIETALFRMRTVYQPLNVISGDFYDVKFDEDSQILFGIIIDVMGHGVAATGQSGVLRYLFRQVVEKTIAINDKLTWLNNEVIPFFSDGDFAAALMFEFDFKCKTLTYSSAGINHFLHLDTAGAKVVKVPGLFLGINEDETYEQCVLPFQSGDSFFFLTDGLFELITQPIEDTHTFWSLYDLCKKSPLSKAAGDDATGVGILVR
ncbi:hypothetical protein SRRS_11560 [Sporomusa rhizae]|uniref:SpoIIE family protein phosphatase n=1 Tax=Sporomusa rhizae TaxID=357999 RepID=UPI00352A79AE